MHISEIIDKLEDIVCNRMKNTDDALVVCEVIDILQVIGNAGIAAVRTPGGIILTQEPIRLVVGARGNGKSQCLAEKAKFYANVDEINKEVN